MLKNSKLYLVLDREVSGYNRLMAVARQSASCGVDIIQLRDKHGQAKDILAFAGKLRALLKRKIPLIINDRVDLAIAAGADGVHLGQDDLPLSVARKLLGPKALIGISCQTLESALEAQKNGADYIGFGSVFKTLTKPGRAPMDLMFFRKVLSRVKIPVFAIGGITAGNIPRLKVLGARRFALTRPICLAEDVPQVIGTLRRAIDV